MLNADIRKYNYSLLNTIDEYGQDACDTEIKGQIKATIYPITVQTIKDIRYQEATYILITKQKISDEFIIHYNDYTKLKVLNVNPTKKYNVAYCKEYDN